jgi:cytochrome c-type biogenesis protein CcmE
VKKDGMEVRFTVTDLQKTVAVVYRGLLPDLFREGQGVIAKGRLGARTGVLPGREGAAKHDENYMPPEVAKALKESGRWQEGQRQEVTATALPLPTSPLRGRGV